MTRWAIALVAIACSKEAEMTKLQAHVAGEGPPLALVGGGLTGWASWEPFQARLARARRVARIQPMNVQAGLENRHLPAGYSVDLESDALAATLDELHPGPLDVVAWSYGAAFTLDWALDHPERVRTLTLIEPPASWVLEATGTGDATTSREIEAMRALGAQIKDDVSEEQLATFVGQAGLVPPGQRPQDLPQWPTWVKHRRSLRADDAPFRHRDTLERLRAFRRPVLLVTGRGTARFLRRISDGLAGALPHARLLELDGGHAPHLVETDRFLAELAAFQATPIVLVGGGLTGALSLEPHEARLAPTRPTLRPQLVGIQAAAASRPLPAGYSLRAETEALARAIDDRGWVGPVDLLGWSTGGAIALDYALEHPERVHTLTLMEPSSIWVLPDHGRADPHVRRMDELIASWADGVSEDQLAAFLHEAGLIPRGEDPRAHPRWPVWSRHRAALYSSAAAEHGHRDDLARLRRLEKPVLLVSGEGTTPYFRVITETLARELPRARVVELPGGHGAPVVSGDRLVDEVIAFTR